MNTINKRKVAPAARTRGTRGAAKARIPSPTLLSPSAPSASSSSSLGHSSSAALSLGPSANAVTATQPTRTSPLLRIPPELRLRIWAYAVVDPSFVEPKIVETLRKIEKMEDTKEVEVEQLDEEQEGESEQLETQKKSFMSLAPERNGLSLARTCSLIRNEVLPVYFGSNTFRFANTKDMYFYLSSMSPYVRATIKKIIFTWQYTPTEAVPAFKALRYFTSLEELNIIVTRNTIPCANVHNLASNDIWNAHGLAALRTLRLANPTRFRLSITNAKHHSDLYPCYKRVLPMHAALELSGHFPKPCFTDESLEKFAKELSAEIKQETVTFPGFMLDTGGEFEKSRRSERTVEKERKSTEGREMAIRKY